MPATYQIAKFPDGSAIISIPAETGLEGFINGIIQASGVARQAAQEAVELLRGVPDPNDIVTYQEVADRIGKKKQTVGDRVKDLGIVPAGRGKLYRRDADKIK